MSDYLWDKTGEPDAEVERLEGLLGTLAHRPRALELPAAARVGHAPRRTATRPALAAAAALALMLLAGAWLFASRRAADDAQTAQSTGTPATRSDERASDEADSVTANSDKNETAAPGGEKQTAQNATLRDKNSAAARERGAGDGPARRGLRQQPSHRQSARVSSAARRRPDAVQANAGSGKKNRGGASREERPKEDLLAVVMERQQSAKAQLVYALRLTGAKLSEVQTKVRGASGERPAPEERNRIR